MANMAFRKRFADVLVAYMVSYNGGIKMSEEDDAQTVESNDGIEQSSKQPDVLELIMAGSELLTSRVCELIESITTQPKEDKRKII